MDIDGQPTDPKVLAEQVIDQPEPFRPGRLTRRAVWFTNPGQSSVVVVVGREYADKAMDAVLAYALAWQGDRDLLLILPDGLHQQAVSRLAWIDAPVRVFVYGENRRVRPAAVPARVEVLAAFGELPMRSLNPHDLGPGTELVEQLTTWACAHDQLTCAHRPQYLAWHCAGRQVLKVSSVTGGVKVTAGVAYSKPTAGQEKALEVTVSQGQPLPTSLMTHIQARVDKAVSDRHNGIDNGHPEHRLQAALYPLLAEALDLTAVKREYPAWRGEGQPGFIDFLGLGRDNRLHVVETKMNRDDVAVVLQSLDYAIWVKANGEGMRAANGWPERSGGEQVVLDFVCAPQVRPGPDGSLRADGPAIGHYMAGQLEALPAEISWRIWLIEDPLAESPVLIGSAPRTMPAGGLVAKPVVPPRWKNRVQGLLKDSGAPILHRSVEQAFLPAALPMFADLGGRNLTHRWALSPRSSQALALNLFAPLTPDGVVAVFAEMGMTVTSAEPAEFEYSDPQDRLGELRPGSKHQTQVDVVLRGTGSGGGTVMAFVEVKFTEEFSPCSAYGNPANSERDVCRSAGLFGGQPDRCFQLANHGTGQRHYDTALTGVPVLTPQGEPMMVAASSGDH